MDQLVLVILTYNTKQVILGIGCVPFNVWSQNTSSKGRQVIRFNGVHTVSWIIRGFVDFCVVSFD